MQAVLIDRGDLVGPEEAAKKDFTSIFTVAKVAKERHHNFLMGKRGDVLVNTDADVILNVADNNPLVSPSLLHPIFLLSHCCQPNIIASLPTTEIPV